MTDMPVPDQESVERWLVGRHRDLCDHLSQFLDPDIGLHEATALHSGHTSMLSGLESHLDAEAGLAAILPPPTVVAPQAPPDAVAAIAAADPATRMALHRHPIILAVILSDLTIRALMIATGPSGIRDRAFVLAVAHDLNLVRDLNLAPNLADDLNLAHDRAHALDLNLALDLDRALDRARAYALARALALNLAHALARIRDLDRDLGLIRDRDLGRFCDRDLKRIRALALDLDRALDRDRAPHLALALDRALDVARLTALMVGRPLGIGPVEGLAAALLAGALDDFTRADLAHTDLSGLDLTGMRWSDWGTTWPPGTDLDTLRAQSREIGGGVYVITGSDGMDKARHLTPV